MRFTAPCPLGSSRQAVSTSSAATCQHFPAGLGCHSGAEAVTALALEYAGLKCTLHDTNLPKWILARTLREYVLWQNRANLLTGAEYRSSRGAWQDPSRGP